MVDMSNKNFTYLRETIVKLEESFINAYVDECLEPESAVSSTCRMSIIIDAK